MDEDLDKMNREELIEVVKKLRTAIREHRDSTLHDLCWYQPEMWSLLPERTDPVPTVPQGRSSCKGVSSIVNRSMNRRRMRHEQTASTAHKLSSPPGCFHA